jgi:hypothetical protein
MIIDEQALSKSSLPRPHLDRQGMLSEKEQSSARSCKTRVPWSDELASGTSPAPWGDLQWRRQTFLSFLIGLTGASWCETSPPPVTQRLLSTGGWAPGSELGEQVRSGKAGGFCDSRDGQDEGSGGAEK